MARLNLADKETNRSNQNLCGLIKRAAGVKLWCHEETFQSLFKFSASVVHQADSKVDKLSKDYEEEKEVG